MFGTTWGGVINEFSFVDELFLQLIKSDSRDICYKIVKKKKKNDVTKDYIWTLYWLIMETGTKLYHGFRNYIKQDSCAQHW